MNVTTDEHGYSGAAIMSAIGILVYVVGIPLLMFFVLYRTRDDIRGEHDHNTQSHEYGFLYGGYRLEEGELCYLWEIVVICRKLGISAIAVTVQDPFLQEYAGSILMMFALVVHILVRPMRNSALNNMETATLGSIVMTQMLSILYQKNDKTNNITLTIIITAINVVILGLYARKIAQHSASTGRRLVNSVRLSGRRRLSQLAMVLRPNVDSRSKSEEGVVGVHDENEDFAYTKMEDMEDMR